jgi:nitroimidazol reductase NimA-like FMN-containing flavoprotein (pyridoxamine 5'-phosphate oxidase superfamily)
VRTLTADEVEAFLSEEVVARIGCSAGDELYVVPVIYAYEHGAVYVLTGEGRKTRMMRANAEVCLEADRYNPATGSWRSVIAWGRYEELEGGDAESARSLLARRFEERTGRTREAPPGTGALDFVAFRIVLGERSGREVVRPA